MNKATRIMRNLSGLLLAALLTAPAIAHPPLITVQEWLVGTYTSAPGETKAAFLLRVAGVLDEWSRTEHTEACGPIAQYPDGRYVVALTTQRSQIMCVHSITPPDGATLTGDSIHDHPGATSKSGGVLLNSDDAVAARAAGDWAKWRCARTRHCWADVWPDRFSDDDYNGGTGYLVASGRLLYQHGRGTSVVVEADIQAALAAVRAAGTAPAVAEVSH